MNLPKISVVIPLYNAEKYIGRCLDSILAQTFKDFEVIVVDDRSTDKSLEVVKSYAKKFGKKLKASQTKKNSGDNGEPYTIGVALSYGEYLLILDSDSAIIPTALEELYAVAKKFKADVVACEKYLSVPSKDWNVAEPKKKPTEKSEISAEFVDKPTLVPFDVAARVKAVHNREFLLTLWSKLIRRDFLVENNIQFTINTMQDVLTTCCLAYTAEKFVRVPNLVNYHRIKKKLAAKYIDIPGRLRKYVRALTGGFEYMDNFLSEREFFQQNPDMKYLALETYAREPLAYLEKNYAESKPQELDKILREEIDAESYPALMAFIFNSMCSNKARLAELETAAKQSEAQIAELKNAAQQEETHIISLEKVVQLEKARITELEKSAKQDKVRVVELTEKLAQQDKAHILELDKVGQQGKARVAELEKISQQDKARIAELDKAAQQAKARVAELEKISQQDKARIAELDKAAQQVKARVAELEKGNPQDKARVAELEGVVQQNKNRIAELDKIVQQNKTYIAELEKNNTQDKTRTADMEKIERQDKAYIAGLEKMIAQILARE